MKMNLNEYLNARLIILGEEFEDLKRTEEHNFNNWRANRMIIKCDELSILANLVEEAESNYKNLFEALADSIREWRNKI